MSEGKKTCKRKCKNDVLEIDMNIDNINCRVQARLEKRSRMEEEPTRYSCRLGKKRQEKEEPSHMRKIQFKPLDDTNEKTKIGSVVFVDDDNMNICGIQNFTVMFNNNKFELRKDILFINAVDVFEKMNTFFGKKIESESELYSVYDIYTNSTDEFNSILSFFEKYKSDKSLKIQLKFTPLEPLTSPVIQTTAEPHIENEETIHFRNINIICKYSDDNIIINTTIDNTITDADVTDNETDLVEQLKILTEKSTLSISEYKRLKYLTEIYLAMTELESSIAFMNMKCEDDSQDCNLEKTIISNHAEYMRLMKICKEREASLKGGKSKKFARNSHASSKPKLGKCPRRVLRLVYQR